MLMSRASELLLLVSNLGDIFLALGLRRGSLAPKHSLIWRRLTSRSPAGTGASGVQIAQEWGPNVKEMTVFMRTPNLAIPMGKRDMTKEEQVQLMPTYPQMFDMRERCFAGFTYDFNERNTFDDSPEERDAYFESLWKRGGFALWLAGYKDYLFDMKANREAYNFWAKKQRQRIKNPAKRDLLCPLEPPHPFGVSKYSRSSHH
jgi:hypothetical protein